LQKILLDQKKTVIIKSFTVSPEPTISLSPTLTFIWPVDGSSTVTQNFSKGTHNGIDIISSSTTNPNIVAVEDGTIYKVYTCTHINNSDDTCNKGTGFGAYGNVVAIKHNDNTYSVYAHLLKDSIKVNVGDKVKKGAIIGQMGCSGWSDGIHLHFEIRTVLTDPDSAVNPSLYISKKIILISK